MTVSFADHIALLTGFLDRRRQIVERIENSLLNVRGKDIARHRSRKTFERLLDACFFESPGLPGNPSRLKGQLAAAHVADGFELILLDQYLHELDPLELIARAHDYWEQSRWPGTSGRLTYAQTIYYAFMLRELEHLSLRVWDEGLDRAEGRLHDVQRLLDTLNQPAIPEAFVRDARWLIQTAQGPLTRHLQPYFQIAHRIADSFTDAGRLELHRAGVVLAGGHLRSQLHYRTWETGRPIDDPDILAVTRNSNSMDGALLVRDLVSLLDAYDAACSAQDRGRRLELADAILQGLSADPELLLTRLDLLGPCTMIEDLFIDRAEDGRAGYTPMGLAHVGLLERYGESIGRLATSLNEDAPMFDPSQEVYSPYGITYGFSADVFSNMAQSRLVSQPSLGLGLEDMFISRGRADEKLARSTGWRDLPRRRGEREHFDHSLAWAAEMFARLLSALRARALHGRTPNASTLPSGRLFVVPETGAVDLPNDVVSDEMVSARGYCFTTDTTRALSGLAIARPTSDIVIDRNEGRFLASSESGGEWFAISKVVLTVLTSHGKDVLITGVPQAAIEVLGLTCPGLMVLSNGKDL